VASRKNAAQALLIDFPRPVVEALEYFGPEMIRLHLELVRHIERIRRVRASAKRRLGNPGRPQNDGDVRMARGTSFKPVEAIGRTLPGVELTTTWGKPALKVDGRMFVCIASHKSAEPDTLVVMMDFPDRDALVEDDPDTYYLKEHYVGYPCVLVRLSKVPADALRDLVVGAHRYVSASRKRKPAHPSRRT
jgi:hypothetical protein